MNNNYTLGIDIGSTTSKCIILHNREFIASSLVAAGIGTSGPSSAYKEVLQKADLTADKLAYAIVTGYGRNMFKEADEQMSEISCHAKGVNHVFPEVRTVIDIGGQDAKVISMNDKGRVMNFVMNDKCAAGTGRFLDVMAQILQLAVGDLEDTAQKAKKAVKISNTCTVFAESEVISQLASGEEITNIVAGICESVASRVASLAKRIGIKADVCMSGGVAKNAAIRDAMARILGVSIQYTMLAQHMGALGAALHAFDKLDK